MQLTIYECYREHYVYMCCSFICATDNIPSLEIQGPDPAAQITTALIQLIIHSIKNMHACPWRQYSFHTYISSGDLTLGLCFATLHQHQRQMNVTCDWPNVLRTFSLHTVVLASITVIYQPTNMKLNIWHKHPCILIVKLSLHII
jgi:hypothetical protein